MIEVSVGENDGLRRPWELLFRPATNGAFTKRKPGIDQYPGMVRIGDGKYVDEDDPEPVDVIRYSIHWRDLVFRNFDLFHRDP